MPPMRRLAIPTLLCCLGAACQSTKVPEGRVRMEPHPDYAKFRPVAIALLPVETPRSDLRDPLRKAAYEELLARRYSPLALAVVDRRVRETGRFDPADIDWDAQLEIRVSGWERVGGGTHVAASATARMVHKSGETLCEVTVERQPFALVTPADGSDPQQAVARELGALIVRRLPDRPPLPRE